MECVACEKDVRRHKRVPVTTMTESGPLIWWAPDGWYLKVRWASEGLSPLVPLGDYGQPEES